jgi:hypothetical protein
LEAYPALQRVFAGLDVSHYGGCDVGPDRSQSSVYGNSQTRFSGKYGSLGLGDAEMGSESACYPFYGPDVRVVAVFDFDADAVVLIVERFHVALDISQDLVESIFVSGNLLPEKIF